MPLAVDVRLLLNFQISKEKRQLLQSGIGNPMLFLFFSMIDLTYCSETVNIFGGLDEISMPLCARKYPCFPWIAHCYG